MSRSTLVYPNSQESILYPLEVYVRPRLIRSSYLPPWVEAEGQGGSQATCDTLLPLGRKLDSCLLQGRSSQCCGYPWRRPSQFLTSAGASGCYSHPQIKRMCIMVSWARGRGTPSSGLPAHSIFYVPSCLLAYIVEFPGISSKRFTVSWVYREKCLGI